MDNPPGYRIVFAIDLRFNTEEDILDPSPFQFLLVDNTDDTGVLERMLPSTSTSHYAVVDVPDAPSPVEAAEEALSRIESWLAFLSLNVNEGFYHYLQRNSYTSHNLREGQEFLHSGTPFIPHLRVTKVEYEEYLSAFSPLLSDPREICGLLFRSIMFYHRGLHSIEPEVKFSNYWLILECLAGKHGYSKGYWKRTLPVFISEYQTHDTWQELKDLSKEKRIERRQELADEVLSEIDYLQRLRSQFFLHPTKCFWNADLLEETLVKMREMTRHAIAVVSVEMVKDRSVESFEAIAEKLKEKWGKTVETNVKHRGCLSMLSLFGILCKSSCT